MAIQSIPATTPASAFVTSGSSVSQIRGAAPADDVAAQALSSVESGQESTATQQAAKQAQSQPSSEQIDRAMQAVQQALPPVARNLQFSVDNDTGKTVVKVVDPTTKEVIRQIPSEELLAITKSLDSFTGLFVKQKV